MKEDVQTLKSELAAGREQSGAELAAQLWSWRYDELCRLSKSYMARERPDLTPLTTARIHEVYMSLNNA